MLNMLKKVKYKIAWSIGFVLGFLYTAITGKVIS